MTDGFRDDFPGVAAFSLAKLEWPFPAPLRSVARQSRAAAPGRPEAANAWRGRSAMRRLADVGRV